MTMKTENNFNFRNMWLLSGVVVLIMLLVSAWAWGQLPAGAQVPLHWGINGEVDRWGGKLEGLFLLPAVALGVSLLLGFVPRLDPRQMNLEMSRWIYTIVWAAVLILFLIIHFSIILTVLGWSVPVDMVVLVAVGLLMMVIGNYLGKVRSNFIMGIRTPWTLSSDNVWDKTHRLGGKTFMIGGLIMILSAFFLPQPAGFIVTFSGVILMTTIPVVYSWFAWRNEQGDGRVESRG